MNNKLNLKKNVNVYISFAITLFIVILIGSILHLAIPNTLNVEYIEQNYVKPISDFVAEQSERAQYIIITILFPIIYMCIYKILQKANKKVENYKFSYKIFSIINIIIIMGLLCCTAITSQNNFIQLLLMIICSSAIFGELLTLYKVIENKNAIKKFLYIITAGIIGIISYLYINPTFEQTQSLAYHMDAYYYPILKTASGLTPYIDFTPLYGCYSYIFVLIQNIFNTSSIMFFSIINAILVAIVLINLSITINKNIKNKALGLITIIAIIFTMVIQAFETNGGPYLQYMPHRVVFVSIMLLFITIYLKHRNSAKKFIMQIIGFCISTFSLFWNMETGLIVLIVWAAFLGYEILFFNSLKDKKTYFSILKILIMTIVSIFATYLLIALISYIRTGALVSISDIMASQLMFYKDGYYMIKMQLGKPWMLLIYTYMIGLVITLRKLYFMNSEKRLLFNKYAVIFVLSILGIGLFSYYQGRSHDNVLPSVAYPGIILVGIFTDALLKRIAISKVKKLQVANIVIVVINVMFLSLLAGRAIFPLISNENISFYMNKEQLSDPMVLSDFSAYDTSNMEFIMQYESLYYAKYNLKDTKKFPAYVDIFTYDDCARIMEFLKETDKDVVINIGLFDLIKEKYKEAYEIISNKFTIETQLVNVILINNEK